MCSLTSAYTRAMVIVDGFRARPQMEDAAGSRGVRRFRGKEGGSGENKRVEDSSSSRPSN